MPPKPQNVAGRNLSISVVGILSVSMGATAAIWAIPADPQPAGALQLSAFLFTAGLMVAPVLRIGRDQSALLRTENVLMFCIVYWLLLDPLQALYPMVGILPDAIITEYVGIWLFACSIWVGVAGKGVPPPRFVYRVAQLHIPDATLFRVIWIAFILGMFWYVYSSDFNVFTMVEALGVNRFAAPWSRGQLGDASAFIEHLSYFGYMLPALTVLLAQRQGWAQPRVIVAIVLALIMLAFLSQSGGRRIVGVVIGSALVSWILLQPRLNIKLIVGSIITIALLLTIMQTMLAYRLSGFQAMFNDEATHHRPLETSGLEIRVDDNFLRFAEVIQIFPQVAPYVGLQPLIYNLVKPVPRMFWPEKPVDGGYDLTELLGMKGISLTTSIVGEFYAMYGLAAICLGGLFFGLLGSMWNRVLAVSGANSRVLAYGLGLMDMVAGMRSMQDLVLMSYGLIGWFAIASILARRSAARMAKKRSAVG